jgi:hypothetical protein
VDLVEPRQSLRCRYSRKHYERDRLLEGEGARRPVSAGAVVSSSAAPPRSRIALIACDLPRPLGKLEARVNLRARDEATVIFIKFSWAAAQYMRLFDASGQRSCLGRNSAIARTNQVHPEELTMNRPHGQVSAARLINFAAAARATFVHQPRSFNGINPGNGRSSPFPSCLAIFNR